MKTTIKQVKELAKQYGFRFKKDTVWNDLILTIKDGSTIHFYDDLEDAISTIKYLGEKENGTIL